jgi:uncharacterized membrane protein SirB2
VTAREIIKTVSFGFFVILAGLAVSYSFTQLIFTQGGDWLVWTLLWSVVFLALFTLQTFFLRGFFLPTVLIAFEVLALGSFFVDNYSVVRAVFLLVVFLTLLIAKMAVAQELTYALKVRFFRVIGVAMGYATRALAVFFTVFYLSFLAFQDPGILKSHLISAGKFTPGFSFDQSIDDFLKRFSTDKESSSGSLLSSLNISVPGLAAALEGENRANVEQAISNIAGTSVRLTDTIGDTIYKVATEKLDNISPPVRTVLWIIAGVVIYLTVRFALYLFGWLSILIALLLYYALLGLRFFHIKFEQKNQEVIEL